MLVVLVELELMLRNDDTGLVEDEEARASRSLVNCSKERPGSLWHTGRCGGRGLCSIGLCGRGGSLRYLVAALALEDGAETLHDGGRSEAHANSSQVDGDK